MKIEKINDNQIRCTLTRDDLAAHQLKLSELAYGTEKAKNLFHDMMMQASREVGFEANDIPLMIEAIPGASDSVVLIITKVDNPEELEAKFSKFGASLMGDSEQKNPVLEHLKKLDGAEDVLDLLRHVKDAVSALPKKEDKEKAEKTETAEKAESVEAVKEESSAEIPLRFFSFSTLDSAIRAAGLLKSMYFGSNTLYKDEVADLYVLAMMQSDHSNSDFNRICNMLSEYGCSEPGDSATLAFLEEHCTIVVEQEAIQVLGNL